MKPNTNVLIYAAIGTISQRHKLITFIKFSFLSILLAADLLNPLVVSTIPLPNNGNVSPIVTHIKIHLFSL